MLAGVIEFRDDQASGGVQSQQMKSDKKPISKWLIALVIFSLPWIAFALVILTEDDRTKRAVPTIDYWLAEAQREDGLAWKARRFACDNIPDKIHKFLKLKDPGYLNERQEQAILALGKFTNDVDQIVPAFARIVARGKKDQRGDYSCIMLTSLGPKAVAALPAVLTLLSNSPPYGDYFAWDAALTIQATNAIVRRMTFESVRSMISDNTLTTSLRAAPPTAPEVFDLLRLLISVLPETGTQYATIEPLFVAAFRSGNDNVVNAALGGLALVRQLYQPDEVNQLLNFWEQNASPTTWDASVRQAVWAALGHGASAPRATEWFRRVMVEERLTYKKWQPIHRHFTYSTNSEALRIATKEAGKWLFKQPTSHPEDLASFIELNCNPEQQQTENWRRWLLLRTAALDNPYQVADWGRFLGIYGDAEPALNQAVAILRSNNHEKAIALCNRLMTKNPAKNPSEVDEEYLQRRGRVTGRRPIIEDRLKAHLETIPKAEVVRLLQEVVTALESLNSAKTEVFETQTRLNVLIGEFQRNANDE